VLVMAGVLLAWAVTKAKGLGPIISQPNKLDTAAFLRVFPLALTGMIGFWATLSLNMPDFTRYGKSQRAQLIGQTVALPTTMLGFSAMAVIITSATAIVYGKVIWKPEELIGHLGSPLLVGIAALTLVVATLAVNIAANVVSPANDFSNAWPRRISFQRGALLTGVVGILFMPWKLTEDTHSYIQGWLVGYSGGLAPIAAVMIVDYWIIRRRRLDLQDLYLPHGAYRYSRGWNLRALAATVCGCAAAWGGLVIPPLRPLFDYAWFVGFGVAGAVYYALMRR
jgi:nucleobase:cation symporter-1, NCS1 family